MTGGLVATSAFWVSIRAEPPPNLGVVMSPGLVARVAPSMEAGASFIPREGSLVSVVRTKGRFILISAGGNRGWIPTGGVEPQSNAQLDALVLIPAPPPDNLGRRARTPS
ncbi:MAG TPA: hypothetical protein VMT03_16415 [Polyangia bacterium]|nr:hypothetical protein [Polyangia bacterium]